MKQGRVDLLNRFCDVAYPIMREYMTKRSCIAGTWVTLAVLKNLHIAAEPMAMRMAAMNEAAHGLLTRRDAGETVIDWEAEKRRTGAWGVGIGYGHGDNDPAEGYDGHVVAYVPSRKVIIDPSLAQAGRPAVGIILPEIGMFKVPRMPQPGQAITFTGPEGVVLLYERIADASWMESKDWQRGTVRYRECAVRIFQELTRSNQGRTVAIGGNGA